MTGSEPWPVDKRCEFWTFSATKPLFFSNKLFLVEIVAISYRPMIILSPLNSMFDFIIPSLDDFVNGDREDLLLCSFRATKKNLSRTMSYRPGCPNLWVSINRRKCLSHNISLWLCSVLIQPMCLPMQPIRLQSKGTYHKSYCYPVFQEELCSPTGNESWNMKVPFIICLFYFGFVTHRSINSFSLGPEVVAQKAV